MSNFPRKNKEQKKDHHASKKNDSILKKLGSTKPALGVSVKSVHLVAGRLGFYSQSGHTKDFKNSIRSFRAGRSAQAEVRRVLCKCCSSYMSLNSVQSFVIENCNGPTIENGLNNVCLHPLSRNFIFRKHEKMKKMRVDRLRLQPNHYKKLTTEIKNKAECIQ